MFSLRRLQRTIGLGAAALSCLALVGAASAEVVGPDLIDRSSVDGASNYMFLFDDGTPGFTTTGIVETWSFYNDNGTSEAGRTLEPLILKQVGTNWIVTGVGAAVTTPATMSGVQTYDFDLAWGSSVVGPGYTFAHHDLNSPGSIEYNSASVPEATHRYYYLGASSPAVGRTISDASFSTRQRTYSIQLSTQQIPMVTTGNDLINRANKDGANGGLFVDNEPLDAYLSGYPVIEWAFYDNDTEGLQVTPLLLEKVGSSFIVRGIGETRTSTGRGEQHYMFDLVDGTDVVGVDYYFGWKDGSLTADNTGVIDWSDSGSSVDGIRYFSTGHANNLYAGRDLGGGTFYGRDYSFQLTVAIPEPAAGVLLGLSGLALAAVGARRGRRRRGQGGMTT